MPRPTPKTRQTRRANPQTGNGNPRKSAKSPTLAAKHRDTPRTANPRSKTTAPVANPRSKTTASSANPRSKTAAPVSTRKTRSTVTPTKESGTERIRRPRPQPTPRVAKPAKATLQQPQSAIQSGVRLQKVLAQAGIRSRRGSESLITEGRVRVNGHVVKELGTRVNPEHDRVQVDGNTITAEPLVYYVLHKPDEVVCAAQGAKDEHGRPTVLSLMPDVQTRVYPVGRLDYHTRGVLLLTNDGELAAALTHPRSQVPKTYHAKFQGHLGLGVLEQLQQGVTLEDGTVTNPLVELIIIRETKTNTWAQLTLTQGLYRQIRRMGDAVGHPVLKLIRVAVADITTDGLQEGEFRKLGKAEIELLREAAGLWRKQPIITALSNIADKPAPAKKIASQQSSKSRSAHRKTTSKRSRPTRD